ncbi:MAG: hypothetical protein ACRENG_02080 [bacterium]
MKRLISRSGSTVAQVLRISLLLGLSFAVVKSDGLAQSAKSTAENNEGQTPQIASLSAASLAEKTSSPATESSTPATPPETNSAITPEEANAISQMLQASLEAKLKQWQALTGLAQPTPPVNPGNAATPDIAFVDQKIAALDRMIELLEQKKTVQAAAGVYQKRLEEMQRKIQENGSKASSPKPE